MIQCTNCGAQYAANPSLAGKQVQCRGCGHTFVVSAGPQASAPPSPASGKRTVSCPGCQQQYAVAADYTGNVKCQKCGQAFQIAPQRSPLDPGIGSLDTDLNNLDAVVQASSHLPGAAFPPPPMATAGAKKRRKSSRIQITARGWKNLSIAAGVMLVAVIGLLLALTAAGRTAAIAGFWFSLLGILVGYAWVFVLAVNEQEYMPNLISGLCFLSVAGNFLMGFAGMCVVPGSPLILAVGALYLLYYAFTLKDRNVWPCLLLFGSIAIFIPSAIGLYTIAADQIAQAEQNAQDRLAEDPALPQGYSGYDSQPTTKPTITPVAPQATPADPRPNPVVPQTTPATRPSPPATRTMPSDQAAFAFSQQIATAMKDRNPRFFNDHFDLDAMLNRTLAGLDLTSANRALLRGQLKQSWNFPQDIVRLLDSRGDYAFLRLRTVDGQKRGLFRMVLEDGFDYHELVLAADPDGQVGMVDIYRYANGELYSQSIRRLLLPVAVQRQRGLFDRLGRDETVFLECQARLNRMGECVRRGRRRAAVQIYHQLPEEVQRKKAVLLLYLQCASGIDDQTYIEALEVAREVLQGDPCLDFMLIDWHFLKQEFDQYLACIDRLDQAVGGDPYLNTRRANAHLVQGEFDRALKLYQQAIEGTPQLRGGYLGGAVAEIARGNYASAVELLEAGELRAGVALSDLPDYIRRSERYRELQQTKAFQDWQARRKQRDYRN